MVTREWISRLSRSVFTVVAAAVCLVCPSAAFAQTPDTPQALRTEIDQLKRDFDALKQQYGDRLSALEAKLAAMGGASPTEPAVPPQTAAPTAANQPPTAPVPVGAEGAGGPTGALPVYGSSIAGSKVFNPDIAVIGDFLGASGHNPVNPSPALEMHESEAAFQAVVDPYARADFFLSFGEEGVTLEEGYMTLTTLPGGLLTKVGKMRAAFGKVNTLHNHVLPWTDRPLVTQNLVGGEDGIDDAGISVARLIPNKWLFLEATGQVFRGDSGRPEDPVFHSNKLGDLSYVGHVRAYQDITEDSNIDLGASYARGHNGTGGQGEGAQEGTNRNDITQLFGVDATFRWKPLQRSIYRSFVGRAEWIQSRRENGPGIATPITVSVPGGPVPPTIAPPASVTASGFYVSGDYQFARRWFAGARLDYSPRPMDSALHDSGGSFIVTYWPSEFSQVRGQYRLTNYALGPTANEFLFQFEFSIGAHGAHPF